MHGKDGKDEREAGARGLEVAVVGMAGRFPGAADVETLWANLVAGRESIAFFDDAELEAAGESPERLRDPAYVRARGVLEGIDLFDAGFFGLTPKEAVLTDPQHRLFLECAWQALEDAACDPARYDGRIGLFAGVNTSHYVLELMADPSLAEAASPFEVEIGNDKDHLATMAAYKLDLRGPAVSVQTGCSTSLVAVHLAVASLLVHECDAALAGGVSVTVPHRRGYLYQEAGVVSPDGSCRAFDAAARGTVNGSGAGLVVLKRLEDAVAAGDRIRAVIRGSAVNNDGAGKPGYTAPGVTGQAEVISEALSMAGLSGRDIGYVEAHGTGTALGDPVEIAGLKKAFGDGLAEGSCAVGSIKTNIGHLNAAAGVAGMIKAVLAVERGLLPASLHFSRPNPELGLAGSPFRINSGLTRWPRDGAPRRAGVSSFGIGGTNAHVVLEEPPPPPSPGPARGRHLLLLSARSETALEAATDALARALEQAPETSLADAAYTLQVGRRAFEHRRTLVAAGCDEAVAVLRARDPRRVVSERRAPGHRPVALLFPGQGALHPGAGRHLYRAEPAFRAWIDRLGGMAAGVGGPDLGGWFQGEETRESGPAEAQPLLFAHSYALARWLGELGVRPEALLGHSLGEVAAACLAGVFAPEAAMELVCLRGRLMAELPAGAMTAVALEEGELEPHLRGGLSVAAVNGPRLVVVAGAGDEVEGLEGRLRRAGVACRRLPVSRAYHSRAVDPVVEPLVERVARLAPAPPEVPFLSGVTGTWITAGEATDPAYWGRQLRETVRFSEALDELAADGDRLLLEVGPGDGLARLSRRHPAAEGSPPPLAASPRAGGSEPEEAHLAATLGALWRAGVEVDFEAYHSGWGRRRVALPTYPFERRSYWCSPGRGAPLAVPRPAAAGGSDDPGRWFWAPVWKGTPPPAGEAGETGGGAEAGRWLVLADPGGLGERVAARLARAGRPVVTAVPGEGFAALGEGTFTLRPDRGEDYRALLDALRGGDGLPDRILHLWCLARDESTRSSGDWETLGFASLLHLAQALGDRALGRAVHLGVVTSRMQAVTAEAGTVPEKAAVLGPCAVLPKEYPGLSCRAIDVDPPPPGGWEEGWLADRLAAELSGDTGERVVAYRGRTRWVRDFHRMELPAPGDGGVRLRREGAYLLTGGLGGFGLEVAAYLAREAAARLVLVGAPEVPGAAQAGGGAGPDDEEIRRRLETEGASGVLVARADAASREEMEAVLSRARERFGPLRGAVHAAPVPGSGLIQFREPGAAARALAPKLRGARVLDELLAEDPLDFFVLFSSTFALGGGLGLVEACAADSFLGAFAQAEGPRREALLLALDWSPWHEAPDGGEAAAPEVRAHLDRVRRESGLSYAQGVELFARSLASPVPRLAVTREDVRDLVADGGALTAGGLLAASGDPRPGHRRPELGGAYAPPATATEEAMAEVWQQLFGVDRVGVEDNFFELGGHSLLAVQLINRLRERFEVDLPLSSLFEASTIRRLASEVDGLLLEGAGDGGELEELLAEIEGLSADGVREAIAREMAGEEAEP